MVVTIIFQVLDAGEINLPESITELLGLPPGSIALPYSVVNDTKALLSGEKQCCVGLLCATTEDCADNLFIKVSTRQLLLYKICIPFLPSW